MTLTAPLRYRPFLGGKRLTYADIAPRLADASSLRDRPSTDIIGRRHRKRLEYTSQTSILKWWHFAHRGLGIPDERLLMHYPLGSHCGMTEGARMKRLGARSGVPDLHLAVARGPYCALWIELKSPTGVSSAEQRSMQECLRKAGHHVLICHSSDKAIEVIKSYLLPP